jgi:hypothetical protein
MGWGPPANLLHRSVGAFALRQRHPIDILIRFKIFLSFDEAGERIPHAFRISRVDFFEMAI